LTDFCEFSDFSDAADSVLTMLQRLLGFKHWLITRVVGRRWIVLRTLGSGPFVPGEALDFAAVPCSAMIRGDGPNIAADITACSAYASAAVRSTHGVGSYAGAPLLVDGNVYGILCAMDPAGPAPEIEAHTHVLATSARLLSTLLGKQITADNLRRRAEHAEAEAMVDELTGLFNRRGWERLIEREATRSRRYGLQASVFLMDLDGLKSLNDGSGHAAGDAAIKRTADAIREVTRDHDIAARLGGDEFALLAVETTPLDAQALNERLEAAFAKARIDVSIGRAHCFDYGGLAEATVFADEAMYEHKVHRRERRKRIR
jgi:diguanylate cyclase